MGDRRLRELEGLREVADADLVCGGEGVDDRHARRVGKRPEPCGELLCGGTIERLDLRATADWPENGKSLHRRISMYHPRVNEGRIEMKACCEDCCSGGCCDCC